MTALRSNRRFYFSGWRGMSFEDWTSDMRYGMFHFPIRTSRRRCMEPRKWDMTHVLTRDHWRNRIKRPLCWFLGHPSHNNSDNIWHCVRCHESY